VPGLIRRLRDGDDRLVQRAVGALVQIGDPRAVSALIDLSRGDDPDATARLVPAVADIGGPDARGWLLTLRQAHPDGAVRRLAAEALDELEARGGGPARK
jgi:HEAT repeat protein